MVLCILGVDSTLCCDYCLDCSRDISLCGGNDNCVLSLCLDLVCTDDCCDTVEYLSRYGTISSEITLYKMRSVDGQTYFAAFQQNMGNLSKILTALRHSEFRFLMMAENITDGIMIYENGPSDLNPVLTEH